MSAKSPFKLKRRQFLKAVGPATLVGTHLAASPVGTSEPEEGASLPTISLGDHELTRLIAGWNPIGGYSYLGPNMDAHMREYFTEDRTLKFLQQCEKAGINAHQFDPTPMMLRVLERLRQGGSSMNLICLHHAESSHASISETSERVLPIAFAHHGGVTDRLFRQGKGEKVHDYVKQVHDQGLLAGVSAHSPENIERIADAGWENDFFMNCFHYITRPSDQPDWEPAKKTFGKAFYHSDPETMTRVMRQVEKPCLGFKILAAGRAGFSKTGVEEAFRYAFSHIKPTDGVIVGMYPRFKDEIGENARLTRTYASAEVLS